MQHPVQVFPGAAAQRATLVTACEEETPCSASPLIDPPRLLLLRSAPCDHLPRSQSNTASPVLSCYHVQDSFELQIQPILLDSSIFDYCILSAMQTLQAPASAWHSVTYTLYLHYMKVLKGFNFVCPQIIDNTDEQWLDLQGRGEW